MFDQLPGNHDPTKLTHKISNRIPFPGSVLTAELCMGPSRAGTVFYLSLEYSLSDEYAAGTQ